MYYGVYSRANLSDGTISLFIDNPFDRSRAPGKSNELDYLLSLDSTLDKATQNLKFYKNFYKI